jgi:hypothetical protein
MRRPLLQAGAAMLLLAVAATPARAQRAIRRAFAPAITPFFGATGFGVRTTEVAGDADFDFANSFAIGVQLDHPLTRRTGVIATAALTPLTRVIATQGQAIADLDRTVVAGLDVGLAGRLKPGAPLFVYAGGGATLSSRTPAFEPGGFGASPRGTLGFGIDFMRLERTGFRFIYMAHWVKPSSPDESRWTAKSSAFDQTIAVGGRLMLGAEAAP